MYFTYLFFLYFFLFKIKTYVSGVLEVLARDAGIPYGNEEYKERIRIFTNDLKLVTSELQKVCNMLF